MTAVSDEYRGRAMGLLTLCIGAGPIGMFSLGELADRIGTRPSSRLRPPAEVATPAESVLAPQKNLYRIMNPYGIYFLGPELIAFLGVQIARAGVRPAILSFALGMHLLWQLAFPQARRMLRAA